MVYGYIRVSTDSQSVQNQRFEIEKFCHQEALTIDEWVEETISGTKAYGKRQLGRLLRRAFGDQIPCNPPSYSLPTPLLPPIYPLAAGINQKGYSSTRC